jgi:hypothetical protein
MRRRFAVAAAGLFWWTSGFCSPAVALPEGANTNDGAPSASIQGSESGHLFGCGECGVQNCPGCACSVTSHVTECYDGNLDKCDFSDANVPTLAELRANIRRYVVTIRAGAESYPWASGTFDSRLASGDPIEVQTIAQFKQLIDARRTGSPARLSGHYIGELAAEDYSLAGVTFSEDDLAPDGAVTIRAAWAARHAGRPGTTGDHARVLWTGAEGRPAVRKCVREGSDRRRRIRQQHNAVK